MNTSTPPAPTTTNSSPTATMPTRNEDKIVNISDSTQPSHSPSASSPLPTNISQSTSNSQTPPPVTILSPSATTANSNANSAVPGPPAMAPNSATASGTSSPSPSFTYASLYEPAPTQQLYDPNQPPNQANPPYGTQYYHPFAPPGQGYVPYPGYYPPYHPYQPMPHDPHHHHPSDPSPPRNMEHYPPQPAGYHYPMWQQPNQPQMHPPAPVPPHQAPGHPATSPPHSPPQYPYMGPGYGYPMPGYYPQPPGQPMTSQPPPPGQVGVQGQIYDPNRPVNGPAGPQGGPNAPLHPPHGHNTSHQNGRAPMPHGALQPNGRNPPLRNNSGPAGNGGNRVKTNPSMGRNPWSHGPGVGSGGYPVPSNPNNADVVGPRLTSSRRQANLSGGSSTANSRTSSNNNDDGLSTASSSTTSSSSRRTYTSTASSQHPLPARPDWAVGLKAQPTLARTHDHTSTRHLPPMSPTRSVNGSGKTPPVSLQSTDFPPLTSSGSLAEKRHPIPSGAWGNTSNRSVLAAPGSNNGVDGERNSSHLSLKVGDSNNPTGRRPDNNSNIRGKDATSHGEYTGSGNNMTTAMITQMQVMSIEEKIAAIESRADAQAAAAAAACGGAPPTTTATGMVA